MSEYGDNLMNFGELKPGEGAVKVVLGTDLEVDVQGLDEENGAVCEEGVGCGGLKDESGLGLVEGLLGMVGEHTALASSLSLTSHSHSDSIGLIGGELLQVRRVGLGELNFLDVVVGMLVLTGFLDVVMGVLVLVGFLDVVVGILVLAGFLDVVVGVLVLVGFLDVGVLVLVGD